MALPHAVAGEARSVVPFGPGLRSQQAHALFKSIDLDVLRLLGPAGRSLPPHQVRGEVTIPCIAGEQITQAGDETHAQVHAVDAMQDSSALVTIAVTQPRWHTASNTPGPTRAPPGTAATAASLLRFPIKPLEVPACPLQASRVPSSSPRWIRWRNDGSW